MNNVTHEIVKFKGINKDIPPMELMQVPVWTSGQNVHFDDGATHRVGGYARFADPLPELPCDPVFLHPVLTPTESFWIYIDDDGTSVAVRVTDGTSHWDITPATGLQTAEPWVWSATTLNGLPVLNNQIDPPFWWNGDTGTLCETLPDWPATQRCRAIRAYKYNLFALGLTRDGSEYPYMLAWSDSADPGTVPSAWTAQPENDAGDVSLSEEMGGIIDALPLRDNLVIYRQHSTAVGAYVGGQYVFTFRELFNTSGVQSMNCIVETRGKHYVLTDDDIIVHDGNQFLSIADSVIRTNVFRSIPPVKHNLCHAALRTTSDEIWFMVPTVDSTLIEKAIIWSISDECWGLRDLPSVAFVRDGIIPDQDFDRTWDGATTVWQEDPRRWNDANYSITNDGMLMADPTHPDGRLLEVDASFYNDGEDVVASCERLFHTLGGEAAIWDNCLIRSLWVNVTGSEGDELIFRLGGSTSPNDPIQWSPELTYVIGNPISPKVDAMVHGRFLSISVKSTGGHPWEIHRLGIEYVPLAKY